MSNIENLARELKSRIAGDVLADELNRAAYSSAACLYRLMPLLVVQPRQREDVQICVDFAKEKGIPIIARGAGTGRAGQGIGEGIILDFVKYMNKILEVDSQKQWVRIQPGLILGKLNQFLKPHKKFFPIDPSTADYCTLGGMIANNSSGPHAVKYGATRDYVISLEMVTAQGDIMKTGPRSGKDIAILPKDNLEKRIYTTVAEIIERYQMALQEERPYTTKNSCGYDLWQVKKDDVLDLTPLLVGSEGTLGIFTEAWLRLVNLPGQTHSALIYFHSLDTVGQATEEILKFSPTMLEIMEKQIIDLARDKYPEMRPYLPEGIEATLFIELEGSLEKELHEKMKMIQMQLIEEKKLAWAMREAQDAREREMLTKVRSVSGPILNKVKGPKKPTAFIEDAAVHPSRLGEYIAGLREIFKKNQAEASIYGHAGDGNLHVMVFLDLRKAEDIAKMERIAAETYELVWRLKGTISGEHGDGLLRTPYVPKQFPRLYSAFREVKNLFDPQGLFNPGRIVGEDPALISKNLKWGTDYQPQLTKSPFDDELLRTEVESCHGCGKCRSYCPVALATNEEYALGRAKAVLLRELISGRLPAERFLASPELKRIMDQCINCQRCLTECPTGVDIPWIALQARAHFINKHGLRWADKLVADTHLSCRLGSSFAPLSNLALHWPPTRALLEATLGIDRRRKLPNFSPQNFRQIYNGSFPANKQVAYFLSCSANYNDPEGEALAVQEVLKYNGWGMEIPDFECCGIARFSAGDLSSPLKGAEKNLQILHSLVEKGRSIVFSEPSCALMVKKEYPRLINHADYAKIGQQCWEIHQFLYQLKQKGELNTNLGEISLSVGYHNPCHLRALGVLREPVEILKLIPGLKIKVFQDKCCGLAGTFGLKKKYFDLSLEIGRPLLEEICQSGVDVVATSCPACAMQIFQGTGIKTIHPIILLKEAYRQFKAS